ncbi:hypothetical protein [Flavobacterium soyae]|uniref:hypothetical protein n=1 Tax=Flavobacterium soyae TaxID=2903098 RepID=UPI001E625A39|nr:hypothetical protein [Flavobacterium soyae]MCD9575457.1 hypothetical protein [Flavobacterium soyae]
MGKIRSIFFEYNEEDEHFDFGTFSLCMYYAAKLNPSKAKKLFEATISEWKYRVEYELPLENLESKNREVHFIPSEVQDSIIFLENDLIPALNNETQDLLKQYGGKSSFINMYYSSVDFLKFNGIDENEYFDGNGENLAHYMNRLKIALQYSLTVNQPLIVYVN